MPAGDGQPRLRVLERGKVHQLAAALGAIEPPEQQEAAPALGRPRGEGRGIGKQPPIVAVRNDGDLVPVEGALALQLLERGVAVQVDLIGEAREPGAELAVNGLMGPSDGGHRCTVQSTRPPAS